jgi:hypothetical protein
VKGRISKESFVDFLAEQGTLVEAEDVAIKHVLAWQIDGGMGPRASQELQWLSA